MLSKDGSAIAVDFAEGDRSHSGSLEAEGEAADSREEVEDTERHFALSKTQSHRRVCQPLPAAISG